MQFRGLPRCAKNPDYSGNIRRKSPNFVKNLIVHGAIPPSFQRAGRDEQDKGQFEGQCEWQDKEQGAAAHPGFGQSALLQFRVRPASQPVQG